MRNKAFIIGIVILILAFAGGAAALVLNNKSDKESAATTQDHSSSTNDDMSNMDTSNNSSNNDTSSSNNTQVTQADEVEIEDFAYKPANITVKVGTTVTWTNKDDVSHTVTVDGSNGPNSELFGKGESYSFTFKKTGTYNYYCKPHPYMKGTVTVTE